MSDYRNFSFRLIDIGLNLREVMDKVDEGKWTLIENIQSLQEGAIATRYGTTLQTTINVAGSVIPVDVHSLKRLAPIDILLPQQGPGSEVLIIGAGTRLYRNTTAGQYSSIDWSGNPLTIVPYRPKTSNSTWAYVADSRNMRKINTTGVEYQWGIEKPRQPALFGAATGSGVPLSGNLNSSAAGASVYDWRYTYYSTETGAESNPSDTVSPGAAVVNGRGYVSVVRSADPQVDQIRLYRRGGTNGTSKWRLSVTAPNVTAIVEDNQADSAIALAEVLSLTNDMPFTSVDAAGNTLYAVPMPYVAGPFIGKYMIACGDINRPGHVYWTNPEQPDSASPANNLQVTSPQEPLIGALMYGSQPYLWTRDNLYKLDYGGPQALPMFTSRKTGCGRGVVAPWAFDVGPFIFFVSQDGIYATDGDNPAQCITEENLRPLFSGQSISFGASNLGSYQPIDFTQPKYIRLHYVGQELHFIYKDTAGSFQHFIYHTLYKRWKTRTSTTMNVQTVYQQENSSVLKIFYGGSNGRVEVNANATITDAGSTITSRARTGMIDMGMPHTLKEFGNYILDVDPGSGTLTITPYIFQRMEVYDPNAGSVPVVPQALASATVSSATYGTGRQKISFSLSDTYAYAIGFEFIWTGNTKIYQFELLWREDEEEIKHWEFPLTSHGMSGWQHVRDAYIALRSLADVTLSVEIDGETETYIIPSTGGEKRKQLVHLHPRKGKLFRYSLDSSQRFRLYGEDCEVRTKSWNTALGYKLVSPFAQTQGGT